MSQPLLPPMSMKVPNLAEGELKENPNTAADEGESNLSMEDGDDSDDNGVALDVGNY